MKKITLLFPLLIGVSLLLNSCADTKKAEKLADSFLTQLVKGDVMKAYGLLSPGIQNATTKENLALLIKNENLGKLVKFEKNGGFNSSTNNGVATVTFSYTLYYENGEETRDIVVVDQGSGFTLFSIQ